MATGAQRDADDMEAVLGLAVGGFAGELRDELCEGQDQNRGDDAPTSSPARGGVQDEETLGMLAGHAVWSDARGMAVVDEEAARRPDDGDLPEGGEDGQGGDLGVVLHSASHRNGKPKKDRKDRDRRTEKGKDRGRGAGPVA